MRNEVKGQSSVEFLLVTGIGLLLLTSVSFFFLQQNRSTTDVARLQQASDVGSELIQQALYVYSLGTNSWVTVEVSMPSDVLAMYTVENDTIVFEMATRNGIVAQPVFSGVPITGFNESGVRGYVHNDTRVHSGPTRFRVTSQGDIVEIAAIS